MRPIIRHPTVLIVAILGAGAALGGCDTTGDTSATSPTVLTATLAVESIEAIRETTLDGTQTYRVNFDVHETKGDIGATVKAVDLQFGNGFSATFGSDSVPHVGATKTVMSKVLSASDPDKTRAPASSVQVRLLSTDDRGTDALTAASKSVLGAYTLTGFVSEANTGVPIGGATVRIIFGPDTGRSATTNGAGRFMFTAITQGTVGLTVNAPGHTTQTRTVDLQGNTELGIPLIRG